MHSGAQRRRNESEERAEGGRMSSTLGKMKGATKHIGISRKRTEDPLILMGKAKYVDDISLPGQVEIAFLRSTHAHADITRVELAKAKAHPDCIKIVTAAEMDSGSVTYTDHQGNLQPVA